MPLSAAWQSPAQSGSAEPASAVAARIQQKYRAVRDFKADFVQSYAGGVLRRTASERGHVLVKKPGRMRWTYTAPEEKLFVADGSRMYSYVPADRQVIVSALPEADAATTPLLFLMGRGDVARDFTASFTEVTGAPAGTVALRLTPRRKERDYDWLTLVVDRATLSLRMLIAGDSQGGTSTFTFTNLKENVGLADREFRFSIPKGADVIQQ
jgi:outer membrane lipoprotein carrier protein